MPELHHEIRRLVLAERYLISEHAAERLAERGILEWQAVATMSDGRLVAERLDEQPHPVVELLHELPDGTPVKSVWSLVRAIDVAKLVTVHYLE